MNLITGLLKVVALNALMGFIVLMILDYDDAAIISLVVSLIFFAALIVLQVYKFYAINRLRNDKLN